jgi:hypothetical protein
MRLRASYAIEMVAAEPEWNDGEVIQQDTKVEATR